MKEQKPLPYIVADGVTLGESDGQPVLIVHKAGLPVLGAVLPDIARGVLVAALQDFAEGRLPQAPQLH